MSFDASNTFASNTFAAPDPGCVHACQLSEINQYKTAAYYPAVYNKDGVNTNADGNLTKSVVVCQTCNRSWYRTTLSGKSTFQLVMGDPNED